MPCNFLDEIISGSKTDLHSDLYTCTESCDGPSLDYICMSCQPFFLKSIKLESEYKQTKNMFQEHQECASGLW